MPYEALHIAAVAAVVHRSRSLAEAVVVPGRVSAESFPQFLRTQPIPADIPQIDQVVVFRSCRAVVAAEGIRTVLGGCKLSATSQKGELGDRTVRTAGAGGSPGEEGRSLAGEEAHYNHRGIAGQGSVTWRRQPSSLLRACPG